LLTLPFVMAISFSSGRTGSVYTYRSLRPYHCDSLRASDWLRNVLTSNKAKHANRGSGSCTRGDARCVCIPVVVLIYGMAFPDTMGTSATLVHPSCQKWETTPETDHQPA